MDCNLVHLTSHDFFFYASQDYGASARPVGLIGNYALMYGLNRYTPNVRRTISSGNKPHYDEDLPRMSVYATPAAPTSDFSIDCRPRIGADRISFESDLILTELTWNSTGSSLLWTMPKEKINIPKTGSYHKFIPLTTFYFYTVGGKLPGILRVGKKYTSARLEMIPLEVEMKEGRFVATCPVNLIDLPEETEILSGSLVKVPPAPLLLDAELKGRYVQGTDLAGGTHRFPVPDQERFKSSWNQEM